MGDDEEEHSLEMMMPYLGRVRQDCADAPLGNTTRIDTIATDIQRH